MCLLLLKKPFTIQLGETFPVAHPEEIWGQRFQLEVWSTFWIPAKFCWFILFCTLLAIFFSCIRCSFEQNTRKFNVYLRNLSENSNFIFLFFIFGNIFWGTHKVWTLPYSVWMWPWLPFMPLWFFRRLYEGFPKLFKGNDENNFKKPTEANATNING